VRYQLLTTITTNILWHSWPRDPYGIDACDLYTDAFIFTSSD